MSDTMIKLTGQKTKKQYSKPLRRIVFYDKEKKPYLRFLHEQH